MAPLREPIGNVRFEFCLTGPAFTAAMRTLATGGLALAIGLTLALYSARRITGPIQSLRRLAATTDRDTWLDPAPTGLREVDEVAQALRAAENKRRRSEQAEAVMRLGIEIMPEGYALYDETDCLVMCNESYQRLFPGSSEHMKPGTRFEDILRDRLVHYAEAKGHEEEWLATRVREHQKSHTAITEQSDDGRWVLITNRRLSNGWLAALRVDITALKAAEQALQDSEERFQQIVERALTAIVMINSDGRMLLVNAQTERLFGYSRAELVGQPVEMLLPERYRNRHPELRVAFFADPQWRPMGAGRELYALRKDGHEFPVEIGLSPLQTRDGAMVLAAVVDITTLKRAEERVNAAQRRMEQALAALKSSNDQLTRAQHVAHLGTNVTDLRTGEREWSDEAYRIFGVSRESFVPRHENLLALAHPDDRQLILTARAQLAAGIAPAPMESRIIRPDGSIRHIYREWEIVRDDAGKPAQSLCTIQDITERRRTEDQLRQAQKMEAIGNLTGGLAHDFNNLLGVIIGNLDLTRTEISPSGELHELVGEALEAAWRGADLTRRLLAFARRQPLRPAGIDINELVTNTLRLLRRVLGEDIEVSLNLAEDIWPVTADPAQLEAALANLANNARDAMPRGGHLIVATANRFLDAEYAATHTYVSPGDYAMIEVSDTGSGMSAEVLDHIFEPFFTTKEVGTGTGLGLSMVFGFMKQSGGHVNVYSEPGVGTTFRLYLPRAIAEGAAPELSKAALVAASAGETILVVEDNDAMRRVVMRQLRGLGYRVLECDRAAAALELIQREHVDLLLTDIVMPGGLDGVELARLARERLPALKIMLTSGFPEARLNAGGPLLDNLQLLTKPYTNDALAAALRAALDG
ncbi:MAG: PAS domain S-box protein [Stellaceae bacterium]